jgi:outer membrane protein OmpA-like peptidoglycan-associated protein
MEAAGSERFAPKTTARAQSLLQQAETALTQDRHKTEEPKRLAAEAGREARHAVALAAMLRENRERDTTPEDVALQWEETIARAAAAAGLTADFSNGPEEAGASVARDVEALRQKSEQQARDLAERERQVANLEEEIRELDTRLAGASTLTMRLEAREHQRQQFQQLEKLFTPGEAEVLRDSGRIIVRLKGLGFASGSAQLTPAAAGLMEKVRQAVEIFPPGEIAAEGHTDSVGDNAANQRLSQSRAEAVRTYMVEKLHVPPGRIRAIGYGDTRPIASNETSEGRRQNRRIDLVIAARLDDGP